MLLEMMICTAMKSENMIGGTISLTIAKLKNMEEGLVSPHLLVTTRITPSFPFSKTNLQTSILSLTQNTNACQNR